MGDFWRNHEFGFSYKWCGLAGDLHYKFYEYQAFIATQQKAKKVDFLRVITYCGYV